MEWKRPEFDEKIFDPENKASRYYPLSYSTSEMRTLITYYFSWFTSEHPICKEIIQLLQATIKFRCVTSLEGISPLLDIPIDTEISLKEPLEEMANTLKTAKQHLDSMNNQSHDYQLLASAIDYCQKSIKQRVNKLQENKDRNYEKYWQGSSLQKMLEKENMH